MQTPDRNALIAWFAHNPVAANLLMLLIVGMVLFYVRKSGTEEIL